MNINFHKSEEHPPPRDRTIIGIFSRARLIIPIRYGEDFLGNGWRPYGIFLDLSFSISDFCGAPDFWAEMEEMDTHT